MIKKPKPICYWDTSKKIHLPNNEFYNHFDVENVNFKHLVIQGILSIFNVCTYKHADTVWNAVSNWYSREQQ